MLSEDRELEQLKKKKLSEMIEKQRQLLRKQQELLHKQSTIPNSDMAVKNLDDHTFEHFISSSKNPTLVDFWAEWCRPCTTMHPIFDSLNKKYPNIRFARVNVDQSKRVSAKYQVHSIPTFLMFVSGHVVDKLLGAVGAPGIHMICKKYS